MQHNPRQSWFDRALAQLQLGESLLAGGVDGLQRGWQVSAQAIGKLCSAPDRWHQKIHEIQATVNLADILRARTVS